MYPKAFWWAGRSSSEEYQKAYDEIIKFIPPCNSLLDVGCGTGELLKRVWLSKKAKNLFGVDISKELLSAATSNLKGIPVSLMHGDILEARIPQSFDCLTFTFPAIVAPRSLLAEASVVEVSSMLLYRTLHNCGALLKKGGIFVQAEFDAYDEKPEESARKLYSAVCREHGLSLQKLKFYENRKITADVDLRKEARHLGYVIIVSKKL
ncbi:methyltransferase domain-containing protein [Candidatus Woesearchaeota archaeon]|nr:methyltransferase domain-containing protein [Candidatus Woesearchaeota archaeon]